MRFDWIKDNVSEDAPCGPDLEASDDQAFLDYYFEAESWMPERYFVPGIKAADDEFTPGTSFDPTSIKAAAEKKTIIALLKRSRDLRLVSLLARLMALGGKLTDFADAVTATADLLETFPEDVHPLSGPDRRTAIDELGSNVVVVLPLQHMNIAGAGEVTYRRYLAATGQSEPRAGEVGLNAGTMVSDLGAPGNSKAVDEAHAALSQAADGLHRIQSACLRLETPFTPALGQTVKMIEDIQRLIFEGRGDLQPWSAEAIVIEEDGDVPSDLEDTETDLADTNGDVDEPVQAKTAKSGAIENRAAALQALNVIETYMATHEPSSPSLLLVTQARLLVGRPLVEAIETLMPEHANKTKINLSEGSGFVLYMDRLKMLAGEAGSRAQSLDSEDPGPLPNLTARVHIAPLLASIEAFFRSKEPASPIPVLLFRAKTLLDKDFSATISDLIQIGPNE